MEQYILNASFVAYMNLIQQAIEHSSSDRLVIKLQRLGLQVGAWEEVDVEGADSIEDVLAGVKQFHMTAEVQLSRKEDLVQSRQTYHYWQLRVPGKNKKKTWIEIVTDVQLPIFDRSGRLLGADGKPVEDY
ncbi:MAG: hypothetical protein HYT16_03415 [DPANN group archaeon]|nr:hypothetical protein [DPANN group archaeon]